MNWEQVAWAKQHDWYIMHGKYADNKYKVAVRCDTREHGAIVFDDFQKLYVWAGY